MSERSNCLNCPNDRDLAYHLGLLKFGSEEEKFEEISLAPVFTQRMCSCHESSPSRPTGEVSQYGLLAGITKANGSYFSASNETSTWGEDPRLFFNVSSPSSTFICGSQGSGKSHTLSCILENCLIPSRAAKLPNPLTAVVFHYDTFICDNGGSPCEAAFLASHPDIKVRVLCAPTNIRTIQGTYSRFNITVEALQIDQKDLNTKRMLDLMAVGQTNGPLPLYMHTVQRILREMRIVQQNMGTRFDYAEFKMRVLDSELTSGQLEPLKQRLDALESFMPAQQAYKTGQKKGSQGWGSDWTPRSGQLTIVDLSCPCISSDTACSLFNICFGIFLEQSTEIGRIVALDEAHKYMDSSVEAKSFTETLLSTVRLQRHLGIRIVISTQEPTISTALLSLCSLTIVHRFSSPEWLRALKSNIAAVALGEDPLRGNHENRENNDVDKSSLFDRIVRLRVGEALLFCPSAAIKPPSGSDEIEEIKKLGSGYLQVKVRSRLTEDGGRSVLS
ncbi:hypothetical protein N7509_012720 [Penicillium cosmopolitanum]|uniref:Zona occludens toxin N-terminal domain-containing protein n=1 Tax=Penicillium cosmopolitanum TaxID=1131564 RepID=A0A9W9VHH6_9EURO|nr:uncharacterized protein N7509_012720 [Penicillium cosmopolitanum]KAJ5379601.1 hypothetical protein N7509_012720 [Penicillium cosmopolitanum]